MTSHSEGGCSRRDVRRAVAGPVPGVPDITRAWRRYRALVRACALALVVLAGSAALLHAQAGRVSGTTYLQAVDLRPLVEDSVPVAQAVGTGPYRQLADGRLVRCAEGDPFCYFRRSGGRVLGTPLVQDLRGTAWGVGEGISAQAHLRVRSALGRRDLLWPRAGDEFDALEAWVQLDRERWRLRLGRQWTANGLGFYNFDGGTLALRRGGARLEAFGGASLVAGLNESVVGGILGEIDDLPPDDRGWVLGGRLSTALGERGALSGTYQRVIRADRAALYSERVALDGSLRWLGSTIDAEWVHDLVGREVNDARLRISRALPARFGGTLEVRRHRPFFESWTIWGAFSPVAFDEARATLAWRDRLDRIAIDARAGWRQYDETSAGLSTPALRTDGWRAGIGAEWQPRAALLWYGDYDIDIGFGASRSDATVGGRWMPDDDRFVGAAVTTLQNIYEFRVGTGRVLGVMVEGGTRVVRDARLVLDAGVYVHDQSRGAQGTDWSQRRVSARLEWTLGRDPGELAPPLERRAP